MSYFVMAALLATEARPSFAGTRPAVVELFTSPGLQLLARRPRRTLAR